MKSSLFVATCNLLLSAVSAVPMIDRRQVASLISSIPAKEIQAYKVENLDPETKIAGAKRVRITYGPFDILGAEAAKKDKPLFRLDPGSTAWFNKIKGGWPTDATILITNTTITLEDGKPATVAEGIYNHHTVFFDTSKTNPSITDCPNMSSADKATRSKQIPASILAGTSEDTARSVFAATNATINAGFWLSKEDKLMLMGEVVNYSNETRKVFSVTDVEYVDGKMDGLLDSFSAILTVNMCEPLGPGGRPKPIEVPKGQSKTVMASGPIVMTQSGYIVNTLGHLHDGGDYISLTVNGRVVCESRARYGGPGQETRDDDGKLWLALSSMDECNQAIKVNKGDKLELEAKYDYDAHPQRKFAGGEMAGHGEVMGIMRIGFAPDLK